MNKLRSFAFIFISISLFIGCTAGKGPSIIKTYENVIDRNDVGIVRLNQKMSLRILACDNIVVPRTAHYLLVQPGHHELIFSISGQTLFSVYGMTNKKYLDAVGGHTYILRSETGWFSVGDKWYPEVIDVSNDPKLHIVALPKDEDNNENNK